MKILVLISLLTISFSSYAANTKPWRNAVLEIVAETDGTSELTGFHFIQHFDVSNSNSSFYMGGGPVYVTLPDVPDQFPAIHALGGFNYHFTKFLALNAEIGFDLVEEIFDQDRGDESSNTLEGNQVDVSLAIGVSFRFSQKMYLKTYYRHHVFDGIFLPETTVDFTGIRLGIMY